MGTALLGFVLAGGQVFGGLSPFGLALVMLVVGGMQAYTVVWDLGDVGIGLMTIFNMLALYPLSGEALTALREYEAKKKLK